MLRRSQRLLASNNATGLLLVLDALDALLDWLLYFDLVLLDDLGNGVIHLAFQPLARE